MLTIDLSLGDPLTKTLSIATDSHQECITRFDELVPGLEYFVLQYLVYSVWSLDGLPHARLSCLLGVSCHLMSAP